MTRPTWSLRSGRIGPESSEGMLKKSSETFKLWDQSMYHNDEKPQIRNWPPYDYFRLWGSSFLWGRNILYSIFGDGTCNQSMARKRTASLQNKQSSGAVPAIQNLGPNWVIIPVCLALILVFIFFFLGGSLGHCVVMRRKRLRAVGLTKTIQNWTAIL
jgi:hypothetical protein